MLHALLFELRNASSSVRSCISSNKTVTLKAPIMTAADDSLKYFFIVFSEKIRLDISCESSAVQRIYMKHQALFSSKDKNRENKSVVFAWLFKG